MPPVKSYSGDGRPRAGARAERCRADCDLAVFFICSPFSTGREPSADDPDLVAALGMSDDEQALPNGHSDQDEAELRFRMVGIRDRDGEWILERRDGLRKAYGVFA